MFEIENNVLHAVQYVLYTVYYKKKKNSMYVVYILQLKWVVVYW